MQAPSYNLRPTQRPAARRACIAALLCPTERSSTTATIEELERLEAEQRAAEANALHDLADHLREAVIDLPATSRVAQSFAKAAREFDRWAQHHPSAATMGSIEISSLQRDIGSEVITPFEEAAAALRAAADWTDSEEWEPTLRRIANKIDGAGRS
jgi:hypothetical protein